jgi:hypothetical protein
LTSTVDSVVAQNPFRLSRSPAEVPYTPQAEGAAPPPPQVARPSPIVSGIIGGPPWEAVVDGLPGRQGPTLVRVGDKFDRLTVRRITRDTVYIAGRDTAWALAVRRPWQ